MIELVELVAERSGYYTMYVFKLLEKSEYIMCTKLPNWQTPDIKIGDVGFLQYTIAVAGSTYFNPNTNTFETYKYDNIYFTNFVNKADINNNNIIL